MRRSGTWDNESARESLRVTRLSLRGTEVAAVFYTLCETARLSGVGPHGYLLHVVVGSSATAGSSFSNKKHRFRRWDLALKS